MPIEVRLYQSESQDSLLRRFMKAVQVEGIIREAKSKRFFMNKRDTARMKAKNNARRRHYQGKTG